MVCSKCGSESKNAICEKCGTPLISRLDDSDNLEEQTTPPTQVQPETTPQVVATTPVQQVAVQVAVQPTTPTPSPLQQIPIQQVPVQTAVQVPVQNTPLQVVPTLPTDVNVGAAVAVEANHMMSAQASENTIDSSNTGTTAIEGVSVMNDVSIPSDFKLSDEVEGDDYDPLNAGPKVPLEEETPKKRNRVPLPKKTLKKALRKTKNMFGKIIVLAILIVGGIYFWIYYVEPSGLLVDIFSK